jgi:hypothetical protein
VFNALVEHANTAQLARLEFLNDVGLSAERLAGDDQQASLAAIGGFNDRPPPGG